jgi:hypothetical protein
VRIKTGKIREFFLSRHEGIRLEGRKTTMAFDQHLRKMHIDEAIIEKIMKADYLKDQANPKQDAANFMAAAMLKCEELLDYDTVSEVMFDRACCKSGMRLANAKAFAQEHGALSLKEKLPLLGEVKYMGTPSLNTQGELETVAVGSHNCNGMVCPCWHFSGAKPVNGPMSLSYCKCCAGHFRFHYQKALSVKLRLKEVVSSVLNSHGELPCVFIYQVVE